MRCKAGIMIRYRDFHKKMIDSRGGCRYNGHISIREDLHTFYRVEGEMAMSEKIWSLGFTQNRELS